jgi:hypothetical protein
MKMMYYNLKYFERLGIAYNDFFTSPRVSYNFFNIIFLERLLEKTFFFSGTPQAIYKSNIPKFSQLNLMSNDIKRLTLFQSAADTWTGCRCGAYRNNSALYFDGRHVADRHRRQEPHVDWRIGIGNP